MAETALAFEWLYTRLSGDATLQALVGQRVYRHIAPAGAALPCVVLSYQASSDLTMVSTNRVWAAVIVSVKVVGKGGSYGTLRAAYDRIDELLHGASGGAVIACVREFQFDYAEMDNGVVYENVGGQYRLLVK